MKTIENKRKILISLGGAAASGSNTGNNVANADTSSDGDMDMELSDYKYNEYIIGGNRASTGGTAGNDTSVSFKTTANTTNEVGSSTNQSTLDVQQQRKMSSIVADDMSLSESDMTANTSIATTNTPSNIRRTLASNSNPANNIVETEEDDDTHSMEMSSISID